MRYSAFVADLQSLAEDEFASFQRCLIFTPRTILGVRTPTMRALAKRWVKEIDTLLSFPSEFYEVCFIKLTAVSLLPYERFLCYFDRVLPLIDNWALCDSFRPKCIAVHKKEFLPYVEKLLQTNEQFSVRYGLVALLVFYMQEEYFPLIARLLGQVDTRAYYVHMAAAWLMAEIVVTNYDYGVTLLQGGILSAKTHNQAIQKAVESHRLTKEQKECLRALKIKN